MKGNDSDNYFDLNNIEIEYNEDFDSNKTKSLTKFTNKKNDFGLDSSFKNISKSLKFNSRQCYAPKIKFKKYDKKPSPIFFKKISNKHMMKTQCEIISEDLLSEKESSLMNDESSSSDYILDNSGENNNNDNSDNKKVNDTKDNNDKKHIDDLIEIYKNDKEFKNDKKLYEHKSIGIFPFQSCKNNHYKNYFKILRNNFHRIKIKYANLKNKEQEFTLSDKLKKKFRLDLIINNKKTNNNNEYTIIPINNNDNSDKDSDDMGNFRGTISYNQSKLKKEKDSQKIVNIYEVLRKSVK